MNQIIEILGSLALGVILALLFFIPLVLLGWLLHRRKKRFRAAALDPFTELGLRPPGESTRLKLAELEEKYDEGVTSAALACVIGAVLIFAIPSQFKLVGAGVLFVAVAVSVAFFGFKMVRLQRLIWDYRLGFAGERIVGETLNQLLADGFHVFHDLPFDGFNVDHVLVGPPGVYVVETKTRRKPADIRGDAKATVVFDGKALRFPRHVDTSGLKQAERNATTVSEWLFSSTGERTAVQAILMLPGWFVERKAAGSVAVLNPKEIRYSFSTRPDSMLGPERIKRIVHQLNDRCRMQKPE